MKFLINKSDDSPVTILRRAGYIFQHKTSEEEMSFVRPLASAGYPRFHCYVRSDKEGLICSFHLDQKRETYGRATRHHGEYDEEGALADEMQRIESFVGICTRIT